MAKLFRRDGERARAADLAGGLDALQPWQHPLGEQRHVTLGHIVRHAPVAERTDQAATVGKALVLRELVEDLVGRAPDLQLGEKIDEAVEAVLPDVLGELAVIFVAGDVGEPRVVELVVLDRRDGVAAIYFSNIWRASASVSATAMKLAMIGFGASRPFTCRNSAR